MADRLPPLTALRAFEAAARHMSFQRAAGELHVTPAALSFQIKSLEEHLGAPLFHRLNRAVELTEAGRALAPGARDGFEMLEVAWRAARRITDHMSLTVTAGPAFTAILLAPRLYSFAQAHPEIELRLSAGLSLVELTHSDVDVAIRFGYGPDGPELFSEPFLQEWATPMMSPALAAEFGTGEGMAEVPLIHQDDIRFLSPAVDWPAWFAQAGLPERNWTGQRFSQADHALDAALSGAGAVLGRGSLTNRMLREGRLVAPFRMALATGAHYRFICAKGAESRPQIAAFREWIMAETAMISAHDRDFDIVEPPRS
ncbi:MULTISPECIES: transcriptional regulator GcvA [Roseovarius]|uniref:Transcriptional regulator, LysR family protein n=4 Tax=Roseovarius TaxID=74030 RepID=A3SQD9_ROSNI|nr:transcriptional regulator GcvA [Roseovarius nubinhibens]EAP75348.1 transcriptional regulator, LysR family protein [Roseovarius nubinhibens ISM]HAR50440.1 transcriptional regulator GcvA [Roseovarius nubinhibens]|tara:strand:- start:494 stop:1435 length:942 start_codon:yes stop_codon:yes gene_type:complete